MFKYFSIDSDLIEVISYIEIQSYKKAKVFFSQYGALINNFAIRSSNDECLDKFNSIIQDDLTREIFIFDTQISLSTMQQTLENNNMFESICKRSIINKTFFKTHSSKLDRINNVSFIKNGLETQASLLVKLVNDTFYHSSYLDPILIFILFSSLNDALDFILRFKIPKNIHIIVYTSHAYLNERIEDVKQIVSKWLEE